MTPPLRIVLLTLTVTLAAASPAAAGIADWLAWIEELSGPGPFHGYTASVDRLACWSEPIGGGPLQRSSTIGAGRLDPCRAGRDAGERRVRAYLSVELGRYKSSRNVL